MTSKLQSQKATKETSTSNDQKWIPFYFRGNQASGMCDTKEEWLKRIVTNYKYGWGGVSVETLKRARQDLDTDSSYPEFGLYLKFNSEHTIMDWAKENGIDLEI